MKTSRRLLLSLNAILLLSLTAASLQAQLPYFHSTARLVQVPVDVFDSHGRFINRLHKQDFRLYINGRPVPIANLDYVKAAASQPSAGTLKLIWQHWRHSIFSNQIAESPHNRILFLFDITHIPRMALAQLRQKVGAILAKPIPGNEDIAILQENPGLVELQPFTRSRQLLHSAVLDVGKYATRTELASVYRSIGGIYGGSGNTSGSSAGSLTSITLAHGAIPIIGSKMRGAATNLAIHMMQMMEYFAQVVTDQQYYGTVDTLNMLAHVLANIPGHKEVLWFTDDTDYTAPGNPNLILSGKRMRRLVQTLNDANISLFPIDPDGLASFNGPESNIFSPENHPAEENINEGINPYTLTAHNLVTNGAATFAQRTGGRAYSDFNSIAKILHKAQRYWNSGYVLYFHPPAPPRRGSRYYHIKVAVLHPHDQTIYRRGFSLRSRNYRPRQLNRPALMKLATSPMDWHGLPITMHLLPMGPAHKASWKHAPKHLMVRSDEFHLHLPMAMLLHRLPSSRYGFDFTAQIFTINLQNGAISSFPPDHFHNIVSPAQAKAMAMHKENYNSAFTVNDGAFYMGRIILCDNYSHRVGSVTVPLNALNIIKP